MTSEGEKVRQQLVVDRLIDLDERPVGERHPDELGLPAADRFARLVRTASERTV